MKVTAFEAILVWLFITAMVAVIILPFILGEKFVEWVNKKR